jgi:hypothetical protein
MLHISTKANFFYLASTSVQNLAPKSYYSVHCYLLTFLKKTKLIGRNKNSNSYKLKLSPIKPQVWSFVRRFDEPQKYKPFVNHCVVWGGLEIGSVREISLKSGLPATCTIEVLERMDDIERVLGIRTIGGDHILKVLICMPLSYEYFFRSVKYNFMLAGLK